MNNIVGHHISLKYLGYEENVTEEKICKIVNVLKENKIKKEKLAIKRFNVMKSNNPFFSDLLYLEVYPKEYLYYLHSQIINILADEIDIFISNDLSNFIPHISCGKYYGAKEIGELNSCVEDRMQVIDSWEMVLHTSKAEYVL